MIVNNNIIHFPYLDKCLSSSTTLKTIQSLTYDSPFEEDKLDNYLARPQSHVYICMPFGMGKSALRQSLDIYSLKHKLKNQILNMDSITSASIYGSITKNGDYVPSILTECIFKFLIIDEWNNLNFDTRTSLLSVLENQRINKTIGFSVKQKFRFPNPPTKKHDNFFTITENKIEGKFNFSCIALAMYYPKEDQNTQKGKAILSRFLPVFIEPDKELVKAITSSRFKINIESKPHKVRDVFLTRSFLSKAHENYFDYVDKHDLWTKHAEDYGFVTRTHAEILRFAVHDFINKHQNLSKKVRISSKNIDFFNKNMPWIRTILHNFTHPQTETRIKLYEILLLKYPNETQKNYADLLGVDERTIRRYNETLGKEYK